MELRLADTTMYYEVCGQGVPLLCLAPFPFAGYFWREQAPLQDVARLIVPDYRGIGHSGETSDPSTMERLAADMVALLDALEIAQAVVMGASMGCYVAFALADQYPDRLRGLVLADTRVEADSPATQERRRATVEGLRSQGTAMLHDRVNDLFAATTRQQQPALVEELQAAARAERAEGLALITLGMAVRPDRAALLPRITVPTLVICGEEDTVSPCDGMVEMANQIPGAGFTLIPNAGHLSPLEQPTIFNTAVREFLSDLA